MTNQSIHFVVRSGRADARKIADQAIERFRSNQWNVSESELTDLHSLKSIEGTKPDVVLAFGGDGTFLEAVRLAYPHNAVVGGVNLGRLGYLAGYEPEEADLLFDRILEGDANVTRRTMLAVQPADHRDGEPATTALNEITIERSDAGHVTRLDVVINGVEFASYSADGIIIATPTGSTAYALSARGPIIAPHLDCFVFVPVAPHMLFDRAMVLTPTDIVTVTAIRPATVTADGRSICELAAGESVSVSVASRSLAVLEPARDFHQVLRQKFHLMEHE